MSDVPGGVDHIRERADADRPSPAIPVLLLALVVTGALVMALVRLGSIRVLADAPGAVSGAGAATLQPSGSFALVDGSASMPFDDPARLAYWVIASIVAYLLAVWIARRQGYRRGVWVDRLPLVLGGFGALVVSVIVVVSPGAPGDLVGRGNVPLLAIAVGIVVWAVQERRPGLWVLAVVTALLAVLANVYDVENLLLRLGMPNSDGTDEIANLGVVALALFVAAAVFGLRHIRDARALATRGAR